MEEVCAGEGRGVCGWVGKLKQGGTVQVELA